MSDDLHAFSRWGCNANGMDASFTKMYQVIRRWQTAWQSLLFSVAVRTHVGFCIESCGLPYFLYDIDIRFVFFPFYFSFSVSAFSGYLPLVVAYLSCPRLGVFFFNSMFIVCHSYYFPGCFLFLWFRFVPFMLCSLFSTRMFSSQLTLFLFRFPLFLCIWVAGVCM